MAIIQLIIFQRNLALEDPPTHTLVGAVSLFCQHLLCHCRPSPGVHRQDQAFRFAPAEVSSGLRFSLSLQVDRNKKDVPRDVVKGPQRNGKPGVKSTQHVGHTAQQKPSDTSQRAAVVQPDQPRRGTKLPLGHVPSMSHPTQPRGRLLTSTSTHSNSKRTKKPSQETVTTAAPLANSDHALPRAPSSLNQGLQDRLVCNKENLQAQGSAQPVLNRVFKSDGNNLGNKRVLAHRQSSVMMSRTVAGQKDRNTSHQARQEPSQDKFRRPLPGSKSMSQKPSAKTQLLQPPWSLTASTNLLHKKMGANQEKTHPAREPGVKPQGRLPVGGLEHRSGPPQIKRYSTKPPASSRPWRPTNPTPSLKAGGTLQWQRPLAKGAGKDAKAASQVTVTQNQPGSTHGSKTPSLVSGFRSEGDRLKAEAHKPGGIQARRVPKTPSAADRKKQLQEWLASKGKTYKRPPMMLLQKQPAKLSWRSTKEKEKQEKPEQLLLEKINNILTECLKLIEEGAQAEEVSALLSRVPQAEKFAKFWICKAKLLSQNGPFDVIGLYRAAVCAGAAPLHELREVVLDILKATDQTSGGDEAVHPLPLEPTTPCSSERQHVAATPCPTRRPPLCLPLSIKLQIKSASRGKEFLEGQELKFVTPVRRSLRIDGAGSHYPDMLKDHDPVVSSLSELLDAEEETQFFFRKNKALPEVAELEGLSLYPPEFC
ncbi:cytoskeleton-associated protein 2-like isoform X1 [Heliangelus exortis]|uniref:cytoskeleton-associated protein 2-like isoform X1 n=1 Tax=Heliangelus exortis TaxID=472823 RepID=UPI003A92FFA6